MASRSLRKGRHDHHRVSTPLPPLVRGNSPGDSPRPPDFLEDVIPDPDGLPVGGRLGFFWETWRDLGASSWIVSGLRKGFRIKFHSQPLLSPVPIPFPPPGNIRKRVALEKEIASMISKQAVEPAPEGPGYYSRIFVVPKATGGWRPIIDLSSLNKFLLVPTFSMETAESIRAAIPPDSWVASLDLKDAYFHVPVHPSVRKYLRFAYQNRVWQFKALPFGLSPAPWIFTMVVRELQVLAHRKSIFLHQYLDDWVVRHLQLQTLQKHLRSLISLGLQLGFMFNWAKSDLFPSKDFLFVGYRFLTELNLVCPSAERAWKIQVLASPFLRKSVQPAWLIQSLLGLLSATENWFRWAGFT